MVDRRHENGSCARWIIALSCAHPSFAKTSSIVEFSIHTGNRPNNRELTYIFKLCDIGIAKIVSKTWNEVGVQTLKVEEEMKGAR